MFLYSIKLFIVFDTVLCGFLRSVCFYSIGPCKYLSTSKCHDPHNATPFRCVFVAISRPQHPATHSVFSRRILLGRSKRCQIETQNQWGQYQFKWYFSPLIFLITCRLVLQWWDLTYFYINYFSNQSLHFFYSQPWYYWGVNVMPETIKLISKTIPSFDTYQARAQNQLRIKYIQAKITKPTQNQVYSSQNQHHIPETIKSWYQKQYPSHGCIGQITINTALKFVNK